MTTEQKLELAIKALVSIENNVVTEGETGWRDACLEKIKIAYDALGPLVKSTQELNPRYLLHERLSKIEEWIDQWETYDSGWSKYRGLVPLEQSEEEWQQEAYGQPCLHPTTYKEEEGNKTTWYCDDCNEEVSSLTMERQRRHGSCCYCQTCNKGNDDCNCKV